MSEDSVATVWDFFEKVEDRERESAQCKLCNDYFNCKNTFNLKTHLHRMHSDVVEVPGIKSRDRVSEARTRDFIWSYFTKTDENGYASCNLCGNSYCYKTTIGNLRSHLHKRHGDITPIIEEFIEVKGKSYIINNSMTEFLVISVNIRINNFFEISLRCTVNNGLIRLTCCKTSCTNADANYRSLYS